MNVQKTSIALALAAINLTIGGIVSWLKLPIYLDTIGLIISTVLLGWRFGLMTGIVTVGVGFFIINPYLPAYSATGVRQNSSFKRPTPGHRYEQHEC